MLSTVELIGTYHGPETATMTITTTTDVREGERIIIFTTASQVSGGLITFTDTAGNSYPAGNGTRRLIINADYTPAGTTITVSNSAALGTTIDIVVYRAAGVGGILFEGFSVVASGANKPGFGSIAEAGFIPAAGVSYVLFGFCQITGAPTVAPESATPAWITDYTNSTLLMVHREIAGDGTTLYRWGVDWSWINDFPDGVLIWRFFVNIPFPNYDLADVLGPAGRRLRTHIAVGGALSVDRFTTALPPAIAATTALESSGVSACSLAWRGARAELAFIKANEAFLRISDNLGRTWSMAETIATGYQDIDRLLDPERGIELVALWKESENKIYLCIGTVAEDGVTRTHTTPVAIVSNARRGMRLLVDKAKVYALSYRDTSDVLRTVYSRNVSQSSPGTWS